MTILYKRNELKQFRQGAPVEVLSQQDRTVEHVGHVVCFGKNMTNEVIIRVLCEDGMKRPYHPANLQLMTY